MENICQNCEYWTEPINSRGNCELKSMLSDGVSQIDEREEINYETTSANDNCADFEPRYNLVE